MTVFPNPNSALAATFGGALCVYAELIWPGRAVPGVIGGVLFVLGITSLPWTAVGLFALSTLVSVVAARSRARWLAAAAGGVAMSWGAAWPDIALAFLFSFSTVYLAAAAYQARANKRADL